jgi:PTS system fructose-specific IIC component
MTHAAPSIINTELVLLDVDAGGDKEAVIGALADRLTDAGRVTDRDTLLTAALARESQSATGLPGGLAIPHCRSASVVTPSICFARLANKVNFGAPDGPADLVFLIAAPEGAGTEHMKLLSSLARALVRPEFVRSLRDAGTSVDLVTLVDGVLSPQPKPEPKSPPQPGTKPQASAESASESPSIVAVTACPTGIAHTYMAADALKLAAERANVTLTVETQGSSGSTPLPASVIAAAGAVIFATDVGVRDRRRFAGKPVVASGVKRAINDPDAMIAEALSAAGNPTARRVESDQETASSDSTRSAGSRVGWGTRIRQILLTGVSYMIPFVAAGGLLIALGFLFAGADVANTPAGKTDSLAHLIATTNSFTNLPPGGFSQYLGAVLFTIGGLAFSFLVPALAGYISFAIADRPGIAPGFTAGAVAVFVGAGFIGGIVGGLIAGFVALWISSIKAPQWLRGLMPVVIIPLGASLAVGLLMFFLLGRPLAALTSGLTNWLNSLTGTSVVILGVILGLMMCFDLGGPVNKAAYAFATAGLNVADPASLRIMAAVMAAGMVPPLAMALATLLRPALFSEPERENGRAAWLLGASFISEGAIPFAAADPLRVIPSMMAGGAVTGALIMALGVSQTVPHGGIFVFFAISRIGWFLLALAVGTIVSAIAVVAAKSFIGQTKSQPNMDQTNEAQTNKLAERTA